MIYKILKYLGLSIIALFAVVCVVFWKNDIPFEKLKTKYANEASQFVEVQNMKVHFRDEGNAKDSLPIVLIHGTGASLHTWEKCVELLKSERRIITLDLPAYGLTGPSPDGNYSIEFYVNYMAAFLSKIGIEKCIIGGNSLGGEIAWNFTYHNPTKVSKLILIDAAGYPIHSESIPIAFRLARVPVLKHILKYVSTRSLAAKSVENVYADPSKVTDSVIDRYYELFLREGNRQAFIDRMNTFQRADNESNIKQIQVPTLVLWGDKDRLIPLENAHRFHEDLPNDTLVILNNLGHVPMEEDPDKTVSAIKDFLTK